MKFDELGLADEVMQGIDTMNYQQMTPVQEQTIPVLLTGRDLIGCAQTGTGKTAAYIIPLLDKLAREGNPNDVVKSLIVVPTRELAQQIDVQFQGFSYFLPVATNIVHGSGDGIEWSRQKNAMQMGADIVIATPGRLLAILEISAGIDLSTVEYFVLDEADRMLDMGFSDDIMKIISYLPAERQTIMFSATLPPKIREFAHKILRDPAEISIAVSKPNEAIEQAAYVCYEAQKTELVRRLFGTPSGTKTIIFASSKLKVKELAFTLKRMKLNVAAMHSDLEQSQREKVMLDFKNGHIDLLVATDIVARGIDIADIGTVVNYDVPRDVEDYIHRIGRTARADANGRAITFISEKDQGKFHRIEEFIGREVPKLPLPEGLDSPGYNPAAGDRSGGRAHHGRPGRDSAGRPPRKGGSRHGRPGGNSGAPSCDHNAAPTQAAVPETRPESHGAEAKPASRNRNSRRRFRGKQKATE